MVLEAAILLSIVFAVLLVLGIPISISIAISSFATALYMMPFEAAAFTSAQRMIVGLDSFSLLAVPFFILSGIIMNNGGIAIRLVNFAKVLSGRMPGSLAHTNVVGNMLFGTISGSSVAAAVAIGGVMNPLQEKEGYAKSYSAAVNIASAPTGLIIPPSGTLIIYSLVSGGTSITALFLAGYIPGILWGLSVMLVAYLFAKRYNYSIAPKVTWKIALKTFLEAFPSLLLIVIVIGGIVGGIFTATEGAAVAVIYSFILSFFFYKSIKVKAIPRILRESIEMTAIIMFLVAASAFMSWIMSFTGIPELISGFVAGISENPIIILLLMNVLLIVVGTFMDITPAVLIFTPIFLPIVTGFGMDPVHFGIMLVMNLCIGNITPPVGSALFAGASVGKVSIEQVVKPLLPYYAVIFIVLMLVTFIPQLSLFIPQLLDL
ncbi:TRAP transporter large permease [Metabacillus arenae]|uniref:TRAP transporter large permease n=1 Tax=Metabacillus arenae TaxID=2771434 RepID=A0A926NL03_9BACI|nr:TRAP transporter large permease [Metabacillus arenae]MBD1382543.1 TRAP transporter large permease [Metabacillus arenae]